MSSPERGNDENTECVRYFHLRHDPRYTDRLSALCALLDSRGLAADYLFNTSPPEWAYSKVSLISLAGHLRTNAANFTWCQQDHH